jgi:hypothetical protein
MSTENVVGEIVTGEEGWGRSREEWEMKVGFAGWKVQRC